MALSEEEKAFLVKIGQELPKEEKPTTPTKEKEA